MKYRATRHHRVYRAALYTQVAALVEYLTCREVEHLPFFVRAFEGGQLDCGLYCGAREFPGLDYPLTARNLGLERTLRGGSRGTHILPLEIKSGGLKTESAGNLLWSWSFTRGQWSEGEVAILASPHNFQSFVVLPMAHLRGESHPMVSTVSAVKVHGVDYWEVRSRYIRPLATLHALPAFPPEFAPYVVPRRKLAEALADVKDFVEGRRADWVNQHTGVTFHGVPRPGLTSMESLRPRFAPWEKAQAEVVSLYEAFRSYSVDFEVHFLQLYGLFGDFKLIQAKTKTEIFVEIKTEHCTVDWRSEHEVANVKHRSYRLPRAFKKLPIFCWRAQWDFLFTVFRDPVTAQRGAFFIPRDKIPRAWWGCDVGNFPVVESVWDDMFHPSDYLVELGRGTTTVRHMEAILRRDNGASMKALNRLEVVTQQEDVLDSVVLPQDDMLAGIHPEADPDEDERAGDGASAAPPQDRPTGEWGETRGEESEGEEIEGEEIEGEEIEGEESEVDDDRQSDDVGRTRAAKDGRGSGATTSDDRRSAEAGVGPGDDACDLTHGTIRSGIYNVQSPEADESADSGGDTQDADGTEASPDASQGEWSSQASASEYTPEDDTDAEDTSHNADWSPQASASEPTPEDGADAEDTSHDPRAPGLHPDALANRFATRGYRRGLGSAEHTELRGVTYARWASQAFIEICRRERRGIVLELGKTDDGHRTVFVDWKWSDSDVREYDGGGVLPAQVHQLPWQTPVIHLGFLAFDFRGNGAVATRRTEFWKTRLRDRPCLVVADAFPVYNIRAPHGRFIFTSALLPERRLRHHKPFALDRHDIEDFYTDRNRVIATLLSLFNGGSTFALGVGGAPIQKASYVSTLQQVLQDAIRPTASASMQ